MRIPLPFNRELIVAVKHYVSYIGVSSALDADRHFLMWDFDDVERELVTKALRAVQWSFDLPHVVMIPTRECSFHAFCLEPYPWARCLAILASTPYLDQTYFKMGVVRGYFTLRLEEKPDRPFGTPIYLYGSRAPSIPGSNIMLNYVCYETAKK